MKDLLAEIAAQTETSTPWALIAGYFKQRGFDRLGYHHIKGSPSDPQSVSVATVGFDEDLVAEYIREKLFLQDPITGLAMRTARPVLWQDIPALLPNAAARKAFHAKMRAAGLSNGLSFMVFGPGLRNGYVGLALAPDAQVPTPDQIVEYQSAAQAAHIRYYTLVHSRTAPPQLSARERDVLRWIARGKSNGAIADILGLSPHTVDTLMRRLYDKLGVNDRTTAAIEGVGAGLILP